MYRSEHPKPQFRRDRWRNLNGEWEFEIDNSDSGEARGMQDPAYPRFEGVITVPFCPQSRLSGVGNKDFMRAVWYRRTVNISGEELAGRVFLHFGAVDYKATVYVNGERAGEHTGGYVSFAVDITEHLRPGENTLTVRAQDDERCRRVPGGKQSSRYSSYSCYYTRTTGIWQTVWLEFTPSSYIKSARYTPDAASATLTVTAELQGTGDFSVSASFEGADQGAAAVKSVGGEVTLTVPLKEKHLWEVGVGGLYDLELTFGDDTVHSYFGLRDIEYRDYRFLLNGRPVFQRLVLDQGFYPDGIYTAPTDADLEGDIDRSVAMGFNGARLHEKIFEERFLYYCDKKGYLVWGEYPNWGLDHSYPDAVYSILPEWLEEIERDRNHPAIVGWAPFNETWDQDGRKQYDPLLSLVYAATKAADPSRPCIDTSGNFHVVTDIYDVHDYEQDPAVFASHYEPLREGKVVEPPSHAKRQQYDGKLPFFVSEYGGIRWTEDSAGWGYGNAPKTREEFLARLKGLTDALLDNPRVFAYCYTQLTDVEQEQNGLYTYSREPKFPPEEIRPILSREAACEREPSL